MTIPTKGIFNPELGASIAGDIGILPMTAMDELILKNPDALLNGEAITTVIKSCVPATNDPKNLCSVDIDALLIAIRYATYGSNMEYSHTCKECGAISDYNIDLNYILNKYPDYDNEPIIDYDDAKIYIRPPTMEAITKKALIDLEQTKAIQHIKEAIDEGDDSVDADMEIAKRFYKSYQKIASHNIDLVANVVHFVEIHNENGEVVKVENPEHIKEFISNVPANIVDQINKEIDKITIAPDEISMMEFTCPECNNTAKVKMDMNPANFS